MRFFFKVLATLLVLGLVVGLAGSIFQAGYFAGASGGGAPVAPVGPWLGWHPYGWGFGGGIFGLLGTLFILFLVIGLVRAAFGGGRRGHWGYGPGRGWGPGKPGDHDAFGPWEDRARTIHDDWHRRAGEGSTGEQAAGDEQDPPARRPR